MRFVRSAMHFETMPCTSHVGRQAGTLALDGKQIIHPFIHLAFRNGGRAGNCNCTDRSTGKAPRLLYGRFLLFARILQCKNLDLPVWQGEADQENRGVISIAASGVFWPYKKISCLGSTGPTVRLKIGKECSVVIKTFPSICS